MEHSIEAGIQQYRQEKSADDIDLIAEVRGILISSGLFNKLAAYDNNRFILEAKGKTSSAQRFLLNRFWSSQLSQAKKVSIEQRYSLIPNGEITDWLRLFKSCVLPFIIENNLPM